MRPNLDEQDGLGSQVSSSVPYCPIYIGLFIVEETFEGRKFDLLIDANCFRNFSFIEMRL